MLPDTAKETSVPPTLGFVSYIRDNHDQWYKFATSSGIECAPEDVVLVRGTVNAPSWALGAYVEDGRHVPGVTFNGQAGPGANAFEWPIAQQGPAKFEYRTSKDDTSKGKAAARGSVAGGAGAAQDRNDPCVLLQYYKIKYRTFKKGFLDEDEPMSSTEESEQPPPPSRQVK